MSNYHQDLIFKHPSCANSCNPDGSRGQNYHQTFKIPSILHNEIIQSGEKPETWLLSFHGEWTIHIQNYDSWGGKNHCVVGFYISIDPYYALIQSGSQVDLGGDVEGLVRCYQSPQLNHPRNQNHHSFHSYFSLILPTSSAGNIELAPAGHTEMHILFKLEPMNLC